MYSTTMGGRSLGRVALGGERFCTYGTMAYVTIGRRSRRSHWHGLDPDTKAFLDVVFVPSSQTIVPNPNDIWSRRVIKSVDKLIKEMKSAGFWDLCNVMYPFAFYHSINATSFATGFNIKSPGTSTGTNFFLSFSGVVGIHNEYGTTFNGISACNTSFNPGTGLSTNDWHASAYVQAEDGSLGVSQNYLTSSNATGAIDILINPGTSIRGDGNGRAITASVGARKGCIILSRTTSSMMSLYRGGELVGTNTNAVVNSLPSRTQKLMNNEALGTLPCVVPFSFFSMGSSLTDDQASKFSQIVQDYQTRMGRAV